MFCRERLLDLRDHLVGAAVEREVVDVAAAQHRAQRGADVAHLEAELRGLVAIDHDRGLRRVDLEIGVEEDEAAGGERLLQELLRHVVQRLERPVVLITNWIGRPVEPGSGGGWKATTCAPAMPASSPCTIGCSWLEVIVRSSHGFRT